MAGQLIEFSAKIPAEDYEEFKKNCPQYGAVTWFIQTAVRNFNDLLRENPTARETVGAAVDKMLSDNRS